MVLWSALLALALGATKAEASGCRADPIVVLTNGSQLQFAANIGTSYSNVDSIVYTVHGPVGSAMLLIIYTDNPLGSVERVNYIADGPSNYYTIDTVVYTDSGHAQVTATGALVSILHLTVAQGSDSGMDHQHIHYPLGR